MSYRENALFCPACATAMEERTTEGAMIDACPSCGGVYLDWFDGEPQIALSGWEPTTHARPSARRLSGPCPKCGGGLEGEELVPTGAIVFRCVSCAGFFATEAAAKMIAGHTEPLPSETPSVLTQIIESLKILFRPKA
jgi:hypothetical protein